MSLPWDPRPGLVRRLFEELAAQTDIGVAVNDVAHRFLYVNDALAAINGVPVGEHAGRRVEEVIPHLAEPVGALLDRALAEGTPVVGVPLEADGRSWRASYHPMAVDGERYVGVVVEETTEQRRAERLAERRARQQARVAELGRLALSRAGARAVLDAAADALCDLLDAPFVAVQRLHAERSALLPLAVRGWPAPPPGTEVPFGEDSLIAYTLRRHGAVVVADARADPRFVPTPSTIDAGILAGISTTIDGPDRPFGVVTVAAMEPGTFSDDDADVVTSVANILAAGLERDRAEEELAALAAARAQLLVDAEEAAERERHRISVDLHDHVLQDLLFLRQELAALGSDLGDERVRAVGNDLRALVQRLRSVVLDVHPLTLEHAGLASALRRIADDRARVGGLEIELDLDDDALGHHDELVLATARELVTNVVKHAHAARARVELSREGPLLRLVVEDDGIGFTYAEVREGLGLASCARRIEAVGGSLRSSRRPPGGARVVAELPLAPPQATAT